MAAKPKKRKISLYLTEEYYNAIHDISSNRGVSMQAVIEEFLRNALQHDAAVTDFMENAALESQIAKSIQLHMQKFEEMLRHAILDRRNSKKAA